MRTLEVACLVVLAVALSESARLPREEKKTYTTKYDNVDLDEILASDRLFNNYYKCVMDEGKCTPDGNELKTHIPEALQNECSNCSEKQKEGVEKVLKHLIDKKPELWKKLEAKYDPEGTYHQKYEHRLKEATSS